MEVDAPVVVINGVRYITVEDAERLLQEADNRRRLQMQAKVDDLEWELDAAYHSKADRE